MADNYVVNKRLWVPERTFGVCIWVMPDGQPLSDGDGYLSAEGFVGDAGVEKRVREAAKYWTGSSEGRVAWVHGARKVSGSELDDQKARLADGLTPDPVEDALDYYSKRK